MGGKMIKGLSLVNPFSPTRRLSFSRIAETGDADGVTALSDDLTHKMAVADKSATEGADEWIAKQLRYVPCLVKPCQNLPPSFKAHLPNDLPDDWIPAAFRDEPDKVIMIDTDVKVVLRFDECAPVPTELSEVERHADTHRGCVAKVKDNPFHFEITVAPAPGAPFWLPTLGQIAIKWLTFYAHATVWWDVFDKKMALAFRKDRYKPFIKWDVEASLGRAGIPLCDCIEDAALGAMARLVLNSFNRTNPIMVDVDEFLFGDDDSDSSDDSLSESSSDSEG